MKSHLAVQVSYFHPTFIPLIAKDLAPKSQVPDVVGGERAAAYAGYRCLVEVRVYNVCGLRNAHFVVCAAVEPASLQHIGVCVLGSGHGQLLVPDHRLLAGQQPRRYRQPRRATRARLVLQRPG